MDRDATLEGETFTHSRHTCIISHIRTSLPQTGLNERKLPLNSWCIIMQPKTPKPLRTLLIPKSGFRVMRMNHRYTSSRLRGGGLSFTKH